MTLWIREAKVTFGYSNCFYFTCIMNLTMLISTTGVTNRVVFSDDNWQNLYDLKLANIWHTLFQ